MISIIIPLYNKERTIRKSVESVLMQNYEDYEIIIVDDGSTDRSVEVVESLQSEKIHQYRKQNGGPSSARNYGVHKAKGDWLLFLDADDELLPGALALADKNIREHNREDVFVYNLLFEEKGRKWAFVRNHCHGRMYFPFYSWYRGTSYPRTGNMVIRRSCMLSVPYREDLRRWEDIENTFNLMRVYRFYADPAPLFTYNRDSVAASKPRENVKEDFVTHLDTTNKSWGERIALRKLYFEETKNLYPNDISERMRIQFEGYYMRALLKIVICVNKLVDITCRKRYFHTI